MCTLSVAVRHVPVQPELVRRLAAVSACKAGSVVQVTSLGSEAKLGVDFADVYAGSQLARCAAIEYLYVLYCLHSMAFSP